MHVIEGKLEATDLKFGLAVSRFNSFITERLLEGVMDALLRHGASEEHITVLWTPGAFELPLAAQKMAQSGQYDAIIAVGAVIRGSTPHFDFVAAECAKGLATASLNTGVPVIFGVVTTDTIEQAIERAGTRVPNRGFEAAVTAIEMVNALRGLE
ncbi:MAG: 6,7-dimethyl-8-ribityllumazine synthase [candidate division WS1 bacterium]|jgi:6,7-dimethyl-8-ribityllumazine synthase|nr:6,7-dimethyl-8-ribityllumazine synthase [candidate division WS1 bacterium]